MADPTLVEQVQELEAKARKAEASLAHRIDSIERENRRLRRHGTVMLVALSVTVAVSVTIVYLSARHGLPGSVSDVVSARQFVMRDKAGSIRGVWGIGDDGSLRLALNDSRGRPRAKLSVLQDGSSGLSFVDTIGHSRAALGVLSDETTTLVLADRAGSPRSVLGVAGDGSSNLVFADRGGTTRAGLGVDRRGLGTFTLFERPGLVVQDVPDTSEPHGPDTAGEARPGKSTRKR